MIRCKQLLLASAVIAVLAAAPRASARQHAFGVPAQPAVDAIPEMGKQSRVRKLHSDEEGVILLRGQRAGGAGVLETGSIRGHVIDPGTGEYLRNAIVRLNGRHVATSGSGGTYRIDGVPAGVVQVSVDFTGYEGEVVGVDVEAGEVTVQNFALGVPAAAISAEAATLDTLRVVGTREGDARSIMEQRASMNIINVLSTESYGEVTEGNPGEFIKYMPGVTFDQVSDGTVRTVGLRGMGSEYTGITLNGVSLSGVDAMDGASGARSFSFEQMSIGSLDSIEISKTISADVDANAPAGTINMRTKRAFDRQGRDLTVSVHGNTHSDLWDSMKRTGPDEGGYGSTRFLPGGQINYSDAFLDNRLGVVLGVGQNYSYYEQEQVTAGRNYQPNEYQQSPMAITSITAASGNREVYRGSASATIDFRATDNLTLSLTSLYNESGIWAANSPNYVFTTGARLNNENVAHGDGMLDIETNLGGEGNRVAVTNPHTYKKGLGRTFIPSFEYNNEHISLDGNLFYSDSSSRYDPMGQKGVARTTSAIVVKDGQFTATRDSLYDQRWHLTQISGPDWAETSSWEFTDPLIIRTNDGAWAESVRKGGAMNLTFDQNVGRVPVVFKTGFKLSESNFSFGNDGDRYRFAYEGPMSQTELLEAIRSSNQVSVADSGVVITSISGSHDLYLPSMEKLADLYHADPGVWRPTAATSASEWYNIHVAQDRDYTERMQAMYFMGTADLTDRLTARAGIRWEKTNTDAHEYDPRPAQEVREAGFEVNEGTGLPTSVEGMEYMYASRPKVHRRGSYDDLFPSASMKYSFNDSLDLQVGYSHTIRRPEVDRMSGVWSVSELVDDGGMPIGEGYVTAPNPGLLPEYSDNLSVRLVKYYEPLGMVALNYYRNRIKGLFQTVEMTAEEFGYTGEEYADYTFRTTHQVPGDAVDIQGVELEFNHAMDYLPGLLSGLSVRGSLMWNKPEEPILRQPEKSGSLSVSYAQGGLRLNLNSTWTDYVYRSSTPSWFSPFLGVSMSGSYAIARKGENLPFGMEVFFRANNLLDHSRNVLVPNTLATEGGLGSGTRHSAIYQEYGRTATIGLRARF